jgi:hypothetical protein
LDELQPELLPLLVFRDSDIFDVSHKAEVMDAIPNISLGFSNVRADGLTTSVPPAAPQYPRCALHPQ